MCVREHGERGTWLSGKVAQNPGKESRSERSSRSSGEAKEGEGGGAPGPGAGPQRWGCVWVCRRGVLREGLARGRAHELSSPEPGSGGKRSPSASGEVGPDGRLPRERAAAETRARSVRCRLTGRGCGARAQARSSTYLRGWKWAGMGRNTVPEVKPPSPPSSGAGGVPEGNQSPSRRPSPSAFLTGAPSPQP